MNLKAVLAAVIGAVAILATAMQPARTQGTPAGKPFRVAMILGTTGPTASQQQAIVAGARAAAKSLNAEGGILGRPVEITVFDHQFDPARAVRILQDDVLTQSWDLIYPGGGSLTTAPMLPFVTRAKTLAITPYLTTNPAQFTADNPYCFDLYPSSQDAAAAFAAYIAKLGVKKLGVLYQSDGYGVGIDRAYEAALRKLGIAMVSESYDIATVDITPTLLKLRAQGPDHLFVVAFGSPAGHVLNSMDKLGWDIPMVADGGFGHTNLEPLAPARSYAKLVVQAYRADAYVAPAKRSPRFRAFLKLLEEDGPITQSLINYTYGWDTIMLPALAAKLANSTDQPKLVAAMEHLRLPPPARTYLSYEEYNFTPADHQVYTAPSEYRFVPWTPFSEGMIGK